MFKILVAEDDGGAARLMLDTLADAGYETLLARDGLQALELVSQRHVDLLVLDLMLPRLDGFAALTQLRRAGSALPVLVLSAREAQADKRRALRLGADDYMVKPADEEELLLRIAALLRRAQAACARRSRWVPPRFFTTISRSNGTAAAPSCRARSFCCCTSCSPARTRPSPAAS